MKKPIRILLAALSLALVGQALATDLPNEFKPIPEAWAAIKYQTPTERQADDYARLLQQTSILRAAYPDRAEVLIWDGIVRASLAGAQGGLGALSLVKEARREFERAAEIDPQALQGSAYGSLGNLYYKVPGWPIGFGNKDKARQYLQKALAINPDGIDTNFFYGEFLLEQGETQAAVAALEKALAAPQRPDRPLADAGRREEIRQLLAKVQNGSR